jgi:hypothetical protein
VPKLGGVQKMTRALGTILTVSATLLAVAPQDPLDEQESPITIEVKDGFRNIKAIGLPDHVAGPFVYRNEAIELEEQNHNFRVTMEPKVNRRGTPVNRGAFGIALNGVVFDPRPEEYFDDDDDSGWSLEPLRNERALQIDAHHGHAERSGAYHYHGLPVGLINALGKPTDMRLIGWAADGFPIYDQWGYRDPKDPESGLKVLIPSYWVRIGTRPNGPGGPFDGTYTEDWHYVAGRGDLDECNGRTGVTPEFPDGTYYYVITERFPGVPRLFRGTPDPSFTERRRRGEW